MTEPRETAGPSVPANERPSAAAGPAPVESGRESPPSQPAAAAHPSPVEAQASPAKSPAPITPPETAPVVEPVPTRVPDILNDPVTAHMRVASPLLRINQTVSEALETIRSTQDSGRVIYFYVVDEERKLQGVVATRRLLLCSPRAQLGDIMSRTIITIPSTATVLDACEYFTRHKLLAFPVIDAEQRIVGAVDIDLYTDELKEIDRRQDSDDLFQLVGMHLADAAQGTSRAAFLGRFPWLLCNVGGGLLAALIADAYEDVSTLAVVAPFIALVTALAESVSIQSVSLALQMMHERQPQWGTFLAKVQRELFVGFLLGGACGVTVGLIAWVWKGSLAVAASLLLGILGGVVLSAVVGLSVPFVMKLMRSNPQLAAGPLALALSDVVTLLCYFNLGRWLLG